MLWNQILTFVFHSIFQRNHAIQQRELLNCEFIKLQAVEENLSTIQEILKNPEDEKTLE
jgi:hypothetical protein